MNELEKYLKDPGEWVKEVFINFERREFDEQQRYAQAMQEIYENRENALKQANEWAKMYGKPTVQEIYEMVS